MPICDIGVTDLAWALASAVQPARMIISSAILRAAVTSLPSFGESDWDASRDGEVYQAGALGIISPRDWFSERHGLPGRQLYWRSIMAWNHRTVKQELEVVRLSSRLIRKDICAVTGLSPTIVSNIQRKYHVVIRYGRGEATKRRNQWDRDLWARMIIELYWNQRLPLKATAKRLHIDETTLRKRMDELGIERRGSGEANRGKKRTSYNWRPDLPVCQTEGCQTKVLTSGETHCGACRRKSEAARGAILEHLAMNLQLGPLRQ